MENDILNVVIDPNDATVTYNLNGNRNEDDRKQLTRVYSAHDSDILQEAIQKVLEYYAFVKKEESQ